MMARSDRRVLYACLGCAVAAAGIAVCVAWTRESYWEVTTAKMPKYSLAYCNGFLIIDQLPPFLVTETIIVWPEPKGEVLCELRSPGTLTGEIALAHQRREWRKGLLKPASLSWAGNAHFGATAVVLPALTLTGIPGVIASAIVAHWVIKRRVWGRRRNAGKCEACGYDLTKNESGVCPECGVAR